MPNKSKEYKPVSALILAAGKSIRMGSPKFMLRFNETQTFLEKIVETYMEFGCNEIKILVNPDGAKILNQLNSKNIDVEQIVINPNPEKERFLSVWLGLKALNSPELVFIHPVDNPFIDQNVLKLLVNNCNHGDYQIPTYQGMGGHPILISKNVISSICGLKRADQNLKIYLENFVQYRVNAHDMNVLCNINTMADYLAFTSKK